MGDDQFDHHHQRNNICNTGNWLGSSSRSRFDGGTPSTTSSTRALQPWAVRSNNTSSMDSSSGSGNSHSMVSFQDESPDGVVGLMNDHNSMQMMMGLGLSSQPIDWNQQALLVAKGEGPFASILQEDQQISVNPTTSFQLHGLSNNIPTNFQIDHRPSSSIYETTSSPSTILQGFFVPNQQNQHDSSFGNHNRSMDYPNYMVNYDMINPNNEVLVPKFSDFLRTSSSTNTSPPKQEELIPPQYNQLHFSNINAPFWNTSATTTTNTAAMHDHGLMSFLPNPLQQVQPQYSTLPRFDEKLIKPNALEARPSSSVVKKSYSEPLMKRPRNEAASSSSLLPPFKAKKEKITEKVTELQQIVSPFGKTDQFSVYSEAIEYIKFFHGQVAVLSAPYMKSGASNQHHQSCDQSKDHEGRKQDLRSRGLCLVPISSTFSITQETTVDFWTPTYGGTFR